jgi:hypothetical protein
VLVGVLPTTGVLPAEAQAPSNKLVRISILKRVYHFGFIFFLHAPNREMMSGLDQLLT